MPPIQPSVMTTTPQRPTDVLPDQVNARVMLGIVDQRSGELYTVAQLFPDYRKGGQNSELDASRPTIDFRFGPVRTTPGDGLPSDEDTYGSAMDTLMGSLDPDVLAFLNDPSNQGTPLYALLTGTLAFLAQMLSSAHTAGASVVDGSPAAISAQENLLLPYVLITTLVGDGVAALDSAYSILPSLPADEQDQALNVINQLGPLMATYTTIVGELQAGDTDIAPQVAALSQQIGNLQQELSSKPDANLSFLNTFVDQLATATNALSLGPGPSALMLTQSATLPYLGTDQTSTGFLNGNTVPALRQFAGGAVAMFQPTLSSGQQELFTSNVATLGLLVIGTSTAMQAGVGGDPVFQAHTSNNALNAFLATGLLDGAIGATLSGSGINESAQGPIGNIMKFGLLSAIVYTGGTDKIKQNFFESVRESLEELGIAMKEDEKKSRISKEESGTTPHLEAMRVSVKDGNVEGFCSACGGMLEIFGLSNETVAEDISGMHGFASLIGQTQQEEQQNQRTLSATSLRSTA